MKHGPRAKRIAERDAEDARARATEVFVNSQMKSGLVASAKKAAAAFKAESFGLFTREQETTHDEQKEVR